MIHRKTLCILSFILLFLPLKAQISHGGKPLPFNRNEEAVATRHSADLFVILPEFDLEEQLRIDAEEAGLLKSGYRFAYKFITNYTPENSGITYTLNDGTKVWRLGIRSENALSLNVLFTAYHLPKGASLFLYDSEQKEILGSFNYLNNSDLGLLPVAPIQHDEIIIEYQEPADAEFSGKLIVGEINHGYKSFKVSEPMPDKASYWCMPPLACYEDTTTQYSEIKQSVVLLIINGITGCTGVLVNNTAGEDRPFLLTASHCLNDQFKAESPDYATVAGDIIAYFNYESPLCTPVEPGDPDQTMASAYFRAVNEAHDMALLELMQTPPASYNPYYAGWNISGAGSPPYAGIHHPGGSLKRINLCDLNIDLTTYAISEIEFADNAHWKVSNWTSGATAGGSSGSPLFDADNRIIGCLTGGASTCNRPVNDYYFALGATWDNEPDSARQLKCWLDPLNDNSSFCIGQNPYNYEQSVENSLKLTSDINIRVNRIESYIVIHFDKTPLIADVSLISVDGRRILQQRIKPEGQKIDLKQIPKGIYFIRVITNNGIYTEKVYI